MSPSIAKANMNHQLKQIRLAALKECSPWVWAAIAILSANLTSSVIWETLNIWTDGEKSNISFWHIILHVSFCILFVSLVVKFYRNRNKFFPPRTRRFSNKEAEKRKHLILFLSSLDTTRSNCVNGVPEGLELHFDNITEDLEIMKKAKEDGVRWNWEMPLRAINHHLGMLETITLICSEKSLKQAHLFLNICRKYNELKSIHFYLLLQKKCEQKHLDIAFIDRANDFKSKEFIDFQGLDFESFDKLTDAFVYLLQLDMFKKAEVDIMIDITGGQKPTSIVGAAITFNQKIKAQYIQTGDENRALSYDVILASSHTGGFGL
ncbi:MAG: hypothetical protein JRD93_15570 [Deltaproteobacteria bacterium]|nr:hypothetical protein [Deltaproteobacteria bacterium]